MIQQPTLDRHPLAETWDTNAGTSKTGRRWPLAQIGTRVLKAIQAPFVGRIRRKAIDSLRLGTGRVLEVGTGVGSGLRRYPSTCEVVGTETDIKALDSARSRVARGPLDQVAGLYRSPPSHLRFRDSTFDTVTAFFVFTRKQRPVRIVEELARVTRPGGRIVVVNHFRSLHRQPHEGGAASELTAGPGLGLGLAQRRSVASAMRDVLRSRSRKLQSPPNLFNRMRDLELVAHRTLGPFGLFTICEFSKRG
ncbi:MAG: class I SAM-dependent methyltransferase [Pseudomonadota bacterium]